MKTIFLIFNILIFFLHQQFLYADDSSYSISISDENLITHNRKRKSCLRDFRQCARKTIENYDDKRESNGRACERWKNICKVHYPAIFKTIEETTDYKVLSKEEFEEFQKFKKENNKKITVEKDGNTTITTTTEIDDDGNEKITKTIETIEEIENKNEDNNTTIKQWEEKSTIKSNQDDDNEEYVTANDDEETNEENINKTNIEIQPDSKIDNHSNNENTEISEALKNSFNIKNIIIDIKDKQPENEITDQESENDEDENNE